MRTLLSKHLPIALIAVGACLALGGCPARPAAYPYYEALPAYYYSPPYGSPYTQPPEFFFIPRRGQHEHEEREEEEHESPLEEQRETPRQKRQEEREEHKNRR